MNRIATLGPEGTFSHEAVLKHDRNAEIIFKRSVSDVFDSVVSGETNEGLVPLENSLSGSVGVTFDLLLEKDLKIKKEVALRIKHNLVGKREKDKIEVIFVHPQTYDQCREYLNRNFPEAQIRQTLSNAESAKILAETHKESWAALVPGLSAFIYKLKLLEESVEDNKTNTTRFLIISKNDSAKKDNAKTSIVFGLKELPGILHEALGVFAERSINLTKIESRPNKKQLGEYIFFMDFEGHREQKLIKDALEELKEKTRFLKILGSYQKINGTAI